MVQITPNVRPNRKAGWPMAKRKLLSEPRAVLEEQAHPWGQIVANRAYGEGVPDLDVDFDPMDQAAAAVTRGRARGALEQRTQRQAQQRPDELSGIVRAGAALP